MHNHQSFLAPVENTLLEDNQRMVFLLPTCMLECLAHKLCHLVLEMCLRYTIAKDVVSFGTTCKMKVIYHRINSH
jgi:hypothetical protein